MSCENHELFCLFKRANHTNFFIIIIYMISLTKKTKIVRAINTKDSI